LFEDYEPEYTDDIGGTTNIFDDYEHEQDELERFISEYPGVIRDGDNKAEVLYKMNEHLQNIIYPVTGILENEESLRKFI